MALRLNFHLIFWLKLRANDKQTHAGLRISYVPVTVAVLKFKELPFRRIGFVNSVLLYDFLMDFCNSCCGNAITVEL